MIIFMTKKKKTFFSFKAEDQMACHMTYTVPEVEKIIVENIHKYRHVSEEIKCPRYCPLIESKILR